MIPIVYIPRHKLSFRQQNGVIACSLVPQDRINLSASKTITVIQQDGDNIADDDIFNMDLALFYAIQKL